MLGALALHFVKLLLQPFNFAVGGKGGRALKPQRNERGNGCSDDIAIGSDEKGSRSGHSARNVTKVVLRPLRS